MLDVLVVGAGPVGLTMAAELTRHGLHCRIVDQSAVRTDVSARDSGGQLPRILDADGVLCDTYAARTPTAVLIRPDGFIGYYGQPVDADRLLAHLATYLRPAA